MGISEGIEGGNEIDCNVGTIVWVRRRNGSWWPGRILGPEELSASNIMSPRSGTPVKLLGREDASVDWYNLEKSKRVKAFRCGEFDDCIQRVESNHSIPLKKREKYARREDAILHALELENQLLEKKRQKLHIGSNCISNKMPVTSNRELGSCSVLENYWHFKSQSLSKRADSSLEEDGMSNLSYVQKGKHMKPCWEDDNSEAIPRMRGLQDFGLKIAPSKRKLSTSISCGSSLKPISVDNRHHVLPGGERNIGALNVNSGKNLMSIKRKRSQGGLAEEFLVRRRDRRRPLVQVLKSSATVSHSLQSDGDTMSIAMQGEEQMGVPSQARRSKYACLPAESNDGLNYSGVHSEQVQLSPSHCGTDTYLIHPDSLTEEYTSSGLMEAQESDSSEGDYLDPDMEEEAPPSDPTNSGRYFSGGGSVHAPVQPETLDNEELEESELSSYVSQLHPDDQTAGMTYGMRGSKWQLKGKRNIRNLIKRSMEVIDGKDSVVIADKCDTPSRKTLSEDKRNIITEGMNNQREFEQQDLFHRNEELTHTYDEGGLIENDLGQTQVMMGFGYSRYPSMWDSSSGDRGRSNDNIIDSDEDSHVISPWEADRLSQANLRGFWEESGGCFDPVYVGCRRDRMECMLVDVDLKVQASYQGERVPLVSLMSRLNGKAIVGHPVQIETLTDGSSELLLSRDDLCEELTDTDTDGNTALPPVWHTARRTTMHRVPRPPPSSALEGEDANTLLYSELERKPPFNKPHAGHSKHKVKLKKKTGKHTKKSLKKVSLLSQKTRTLSSIAIEQVPYGRSGDFKLAKKDRDFHGLLKPEGKAPVVTCVPVKLVFSRIREAVARPRASVANHRMLRAGSADIKLA